MKKFFWIMFLLLVCVISVNAEKSIDSFACNYHLMCIEPYGARSIGNGQCSSSYDLGNIQILVDGYNNGNYENITTSILYYENNMDSAVSVTANKKFSNYKNYGLGTDKVCSNKNKTYNREMYILEGDSTGNNFAYLFSRENKCPTLYCAVVAKTKVVIVENKEEYLNSSWTEQTDLSATNTLFKNSSENEWKTPTDFYTEKKPDGSETSTYKEPLTCSYDLEPLGEYYDTGVALNLNNSNTVNVKLITNYNTNGSIKSYKVSANGSEYVILPNELGVKDVQFGFGEERVDTAYELYITIDQQKNIFNGSCPDKNSLYLYLNKFNNVAGVLGYKLTTSKEEVDGEILDVDFDHDNTGNAEYEGQYRIGFGEGLDLDIDNMSKSCSEILGNNLTKIVKFAIILLRVAGAVIAIVNSMIALVPAVMSKDADALQKAKGKCISMGILLAVILVFPSILRFIGNVLGFDISCIV